MEEVKAEETKAESEDKKLTAKAISKIFKLIAPLGMITCAILKWAGILPNASMGEICMLWATVYGLGAGTIDLNIMFDKFVGGRNDSRD